MYAGWREQIYLCLDSLRADVTICLMIENLPALIRALCEPGAYDHSVDAVELVETHISWVLLAGQFAYKIKKPVRLVFLDFSTLDLRHRYCLAELELNKRFAPDLYIGVVGIGEGLQGLQMYPTSEPIEYAIKMRRFDEALRLDHVCERGELTADHLSGLARSLSKLYAKAPVAEQNATHGSLDDIGRQALDNFVDPTKVLTDPVDQARLQSMRDWTLSQVKALTPLFLERRAAGFVRECHGDLHLGNLVLMDGQITAFDCIEFADDLRWIDVASDVAFLFVDLMARAQFGLANWWLNEFLSQTGDYGALPVLRFYTVYRAMVRLKVCCIRSAQTGVREHEIQTYLALAEQLMNASAIELVITHGVSGCGKSWSAAAWIRQDRPDLRLRLRADVERKRLFGVAELAHTHSGPRQGIYAETASRQTYTHLMSLSEQALRAGWSVVIDASFLKRQDRLCAETLAQSVGVDWHILAPAAPLSQMRSRIRARQAAGRDASEADLAVLEMQLQTMEPLTDAERALVLDAY